MSGINEGVNLGYDLLYSGTVAAAREGALNNIKSIAISIDKSNKKILSLLIPVSKTRKIQIVKNLETGQLKKEEIVTNLTKRLELKEGVIKSSLYKSATKPKRTT